MSRRSLFAATGAVLAVGLAACTANDPLAKQAAAGDNKGFVAGDGSVTEFALDKRSDPVEFSGKLFDGSTISAAKLRGKVTILNFWYAGCSPCRKEAPDLQALNAEFEPQGVKFLGVNIRDEAATAEAFERGYKLTYPSIMDKDGGVLLALSQLNLVKPSAVPTTLVLDKQGRVSARLLGEADKSTLKALITSVLAEK
ncbi:TlpA family protein disulfide reductase [Arthrobacter livingstonensis]|nr:TlpA disulfide reductase family protein [Arthrobacter livingstonensis]